eukprot:TRINITY_DN74285_c0_g1_i1.p1 TRINITY_DN74285_c0_g1~~TRINITY_DN74285_c0_g1_i1.p1  ORF type:complete len:213 (+),score=61.34 TRINITY_DN74285_c0_g1_i1:18-656(+)
MSALFYSSDSITPSVVAMDVAEQPSLDPYERVRTTFFECNAATDGKMQRLELVNLLKTLDAKVWTDSRIEKLMHVADRQGDGHISVGDLLVWLFAKGDDDGSEIEVAMATSKARDALNNLVEMFDEKADEEDLADEEVEAPRTDEELKADARECLTVLFSPNLDGRDVGRHYIKKVLKGSRSRSSSSVSRRRHGRSKNKDGANNLTAEAEGG